MTLEQCIRNLVADSSVEIESADCNCRIELRVMHTGKYTAIVRPKNGYVFQNFADTGEELAEGIVKSLRSRKLYPTEADWEFFKTRVQLKEEIVALKARIAELEGSGQHDA